MTVNSFFAGIGGFDLGFERNGFKIKFQCEVNDFCKNVLKKHWKNIPLSGDIRNLSSEDIPNATVWCGGFPCQDVSLARGSSLREGLRGANSGLYFEFLRLVREKLPKVILLENVVGLLNSHNGKDFKIIIESLTSLGYAVSWRVLNTRYFGAPQSRPRVFICAWYDNLPKAVLSLYETKLSLRPKNLRMDFITFDEDSNKHIKVPKIAYCLAATSGRHTGTDWSRTYVSYYDSVRRLTPLEAERLQGFPNNWTNLNSINSKIDKDSLRYHAVGNAVSVPVVEWISGRIREQLGKRVKSISLVEYIKTKIPDFASIDNSTTNVNQISDSYKWKAGGFAYNDIIIQIDASSCSSKIVKSNLIDSIDKGEVDEKYFLSASAAKGILRRVESQNRVLFQPLSEALHRLSLRTNENELINETLHN